MDFIKSIKQSIEILKLNLKAINEVAKDKNATLAGILILIIGGLAAGITSKRPVMILAIPISTLLLSFIAVGILHISAKLLGGKAKFMELFRVLAHAGILNWLSILYFVPYLKTPISLISSLWGIVVNFITIKNIYKLSNGRTILTLLIPVIFFTILTVLFVLAYNAVMTKTLT